MSVPGPTRAPASFLSCGFRPFFLSAGACAAIAILLWLPVFLGAITLPIAIAPRDWHVHEMLYGYAAAAIAGFLLTAIPNWTGRPAVAGLPLLLLLAAWLAGRFAMASSSVIGVVPAALLDLVFLPLVALVAGRELIAAGNRRNYKILGVLAVLLAGNVFFHLETIEDGIADYGARIGLATVAALVMVIGGRIVPNFTRNALLHAGPGRQPLPFGRFDIATLGTSVLALALWVALPAAPATSLLCLAAALLQAVRLARWAGERARRDGLVLILHLAYGFIPLGFLLIGLQPVCLQLGHALPASAGIHAWGTGAIGLMTLAVMTRATLGHTGRPLAASRGTLLVYGLALVAAVIRIAAALPIPHAAGLLELAALAWVLAFCGFAAIYGPMMVRPGLVAGPPGC